MLTKTTNYDFKTQDRPEIIFGRRVFIKIADERFQPIL